MATLVADKLKQVPLPKNTVAVAQQDGRIYLVDFTENPHMDDPGQIDWSISVAKLLVGKIQLTRSKHVTLEEVEIENITHTEQFLPGTFVDTRLTIFGSLDGKNDTISVNPAIAEDDGGYISARCRVTAKNFGVQLCGTYNVNTIQVTLHQNGRR